MAKTSVYSVAENEGRPPYWLRRAVRKAKRRGRTGLLLHGRIRAGFRTITLGTVSVEVWEGERRLASVSHTDVTRFPRWAALSPGEHRLTFRAGWKASSQFSRTVRVGPGDVLAFTCEPIQPWTVYRRSPRADTWRMWLL